MAVPGPFVPSISDTHCQCKTHSLTHITLQTSPIRGRPGDRPQRAQSPSGAFQALQGHPCTNTTNRNLSPWQQARVFHKLPSAIIQPSRSHVIAHSTLSISTRILITQIHGLSHSGNRLDSPDSIHSRLLSTALLIKDAGDLHC